MKTRWKAFFGLLLAAEKKISDDKIPMMGAALAYYTMFSIAPLLVIALGVVGMIFGEKGDNQIFSQIGDLVGGNGALAIEGMVRGAAAHPHNGKMATIVGGITLVVGSSGIFAQLQDSLNMIWRVAKKPNASFWSVVRQRLVSFAMVGVISFLLLVSLLANAALSAAGSTTLIVVPGGVLIWQTIDFTISIMVTAVLFALVFKVLPDVVISWRDALVGGLFTAVLFTIGKFAIGAYLGRSGIASAYGAAGSLVVVLLWIFYSSELVLFGAEFTQAYATRGGKTVVPRRDAARTVTQFTVAAMAEKAAQKK